MRRRRRLVGLQPVPRRGPAVERAAPRRFRYPLSAQPPVVGRLGASHRLPQPVAVPRQVPARWMLVRVVVRVLGARPLDRGRSDQVRSDQVPVSPLPAQGRVWGPAELRTPDLARMLAARGAWRATTPGRRRADRALRRQDRVRLLVRSRRALQLAPDTARATRQPR